MEISRQVRGVLSLDDQGYHDQWTYFVDNLSGTPSLRRLRAMEASEIPRKGDPHPDGLPNCVVTDVAAAYQSDGDPLQAEVVVTFGPPTQGDLQGLQGTGIKSVEVSTGTLGARTNLDYKGQQMLVVYRGPEVTIPGVSGGSFSASTPAQTVTSVIRSLLAEADYDIATMTVVVTVERRLPSHIESQKVATRVNTDRWSGLDPFKWLCLGIDSSENETGNYDWRYIFAIAPRLPDNATWKFRAEGTPFEITPSRTLENGETRGGAFIRFDNVLGNGVELFDVYEPISFRQAFDFEIPFQ